MPAWRHWLQPFSKEIYTHTWHISMNKHGCHIQNIAQTTNMLLKYIDPIVLHVYAKQNQLQLLLHMLLNICQMQIYPPNWAHVSIKHVHMRMYTYIFAIWHHWHNPFNKEHCTHIWHISLNKYGCHIQNIAQTTNMLLECIDPIFLHVYAKTKPTAASTSQLLPGMCQKQRHKEFDHLSLAFPTPRVRACMCKL